MEISQKNVLRSLVVLSVPTVIEHISSTLLQYVDTAMVGHLGKYATASVSTTTTVNWLIGNFMFALGIAALAVISKANGENDTQRMSKVNSHMLVYSIVMGVFLTVTCIGLSPFIPVWMGTEEIVRHDATVYFAILSMSLVPRTFAIVFASSIRATKDTKTPMIINISSNIVNVGLNAVLIYGAGLGVTGAAIASAVSYTGAGILMAVIASGREKIRIRKEYIRHMDGGILKETVKIGLPVLGTGVTSCLGYVFFAGMVSGMGTTIFAAHSIAVTAEELFYIPGYGFRTATSSLVGNSIGEGDKKKQSTTEKLSIYITVGAMVLSGILLFFLSEGLMRMFSSDAEVISMGAGVLKLVSFSEPFFGLMIVLEGIYYGKGKTRGVFIIETLCMWGVRIALTYVTVHFLNGDLTHVWYCMIADNVLKALVLFATYMNDKRKEKRSLH